MWAEAFWAHNRTDTAMASWASARAGRARDTVQARRHTRLSTDLGQSVPLASNASEMQHPMCCSTAKVGSNAVRRKTPYRQQAIHNASAPAPVPVDATRLASPVARLGKWPTLPHAAPHTPTLGTKHAPLACPMLLALVRRIFVHGRLLLGAAAACRTGTPPSTAQAHRSTSAFISGFYQP